MRFLLLWLGLAAGNFIFQAITIRDWLKALDRSYFQGIALLVAFLITN